MTSPSCTDLITHGSWPWLLLLVGGVWAWVTREKKHTEKLIELQRSYDADMGRLMELREAEVKKLRASYDDELKAIREAKNLVWLHVTDDPEKRPKNARRCPTCGGQIPGNLMGSANGVRGDH